MKISALNTAVRGIAFGRAPKGDWTEQKVGKTVDWDSNVSEAQDFHNTITASKNYLGIKNLTLIMHGPSFPVGEDDLFIGSPINSAAVKTNKLLKLHGFDSIQLGPPGLIFRQNVSPYSSSIYSRNYLFTDMTKLTQKEYANLLSLDDIREYSKNVDKNTERTDFEKAFQSYDILFSIALDNLENKVKQGDADAISLKIDFEEFKKQNAHWLDGDATGSILTDKFKSLDFHDWPIEYQKPENDEVKSLVAQNSDKVELFKFQQFIIRKQENEFIKENPDKLKYNSDAIIGFSMLDYYNHQDAFLKDMYVGCPYGGKGSAKEQGTPWGNNQTWRIPVINPQKLFKPDGSLDIGGQLIKDKFENLLDTYQNIRIDHALGLVDPWLYNDNDVETTYKGQIKDENIISVTAHGANLNDFAKENVFKMRDDWNEKTRDIYRQINERIKHLPNIDPDKNYVKIIEKILLPLLAEKGLNPKNLVWEDLCCPTKTFEDLYYNKLKLPGIISLKQYQGQKKMHLTDYTFMNLSHDDPPASKMYSKKLYRQNSYDGGYFNPAYLIGWLHPEKTNDERKILIDNMVNDTRLRVITKFQELFRSGKKIQVSFMDFFGLDKTYNKMGTTDKDNWTLRLTKDFEERYYKTLENKSDDKVALNNPELLKRAIISTILANENAKDVKAKEMAEAKPLLDKLEYFENMLYEPEK